MSVNTIQLNRTHLELNYQDLTNVVYKKFYNDIFPNHSLRKGLEDISHLTRFSERIQTPNEVEDALKNTFEKVFTNYKFEITVDESLDEDDLNNYQYVKCFEIHSKTFIYDTKHALNKNNLNQTLFVKVNIIK